MMAEHGFSMEFRGVLFDITVSYDDDPRRWLLRSAVPHDDGADFAVWIRDDNHTYAEFDRLCDPVMHEYHATGGVDAVDAARDKIEETFKRR